MFNQEFDIKQLLTVIKRHKYMFIGVIIVVLSFTAIYLYRAQRVYKAVVMVEIEPRAANVLGRGMEVVSVGAPGYYWSNKEYYATQHEIIKSREVCARVIEDIPPSMLDRFMRPSGIAGQTEDGRAVEKDGEKKEPDPVSRLQGSIAITSKKDSNIFYVSVRHTVPEVAAFFANAVAGSYVDFNLEKKYIATKDAAKWLSEQSSNLKEKLEESETSLFEFREENGILASSFDASDKMLSEKIRRLQNEITEREISFNALQTKLKQLQDQPEEMIQSSLFDGNNTGDIVEKLKVKYFDLESTLEQRRQFYGEKHPRVLELNAAIEKVRTAIDREIQTLVTGVERRSSALSQELKNLRGMLQRAKMQAVELNRLRIKYNKIQREVDTTNKLYNLVLERTKEADLSSLLKNNNIRVIDKAMVPAAPVEPRVRLVLIIGLFLAVFIAMLSVFLIEFFDTRIHNFDELESLIDASILGVIPRFENDTDTEISEMAFDARGHSSAVEALRSIRTNIRLASPDVDRLSFLITSSDSKEGKTTVSANVAASFAMAGKKVVLIDTDMRKPRVHTLFGIQNDRGISNCMIDEYSLDDVIKTDVYRGLDVLTCGPIPPNPPELIESRKFHEITAELKERYEIVIFDSPPVGAVTDAAVIASHVDSVILVVKIRETGKDFLKNTVSQIKRADTRLLGAVVNNVDIKAGSRYGSYYYYYYQRSDYYEEDGEHEDS